MQGSIQSGSHRFVLACLSVVTIAVNDNWQERCHTWSRGLVLAEPGGFSRRFMLKASQINHSFISVCHSESACRAGDDDDDNVLPSHLSLHSLSQAEWFRDKPLCRRTAEATKRWWSPKALWLARSSHCVLSALFLEYQVIRMYSCCQAYIAIKIIVSSQAVKWSQDEKIFLNNSNCKCRKRSLQPLTVILTQVVCQLLFASADSIHLDSRRIQNCFW